MKDIILRFIKKHPITFVSIISFAIVAVRLISYGEIYTVTDESKIVNELAVLFNHIIFGSFLFYKIIDVYENKLSDKIVKNTIVINLLALILPTVFYIISKLILKLSSGFVIFGMGSFLAVYCSLAYYFIIKKNNVLVYKYLLNVFMNVLFLSLIYVIVACGIGVLIYLYYVLFRMVNEIYPLNIFVFITILIAYIGYFIVLEKIDDKTTLFSKILVKYIMMAMVIISFAFFYVYIIMIIISRQIPSNKIFSACTILFFAGLPAALMCRSFEDGNIYDNIIKHLPLAFIPILICQIISLYLRINEYGLTSTRCIGVFIILYEAIYIYVYKCKYDKLKLIFLVQAIMFFIMSFLPKF